MTYHFTKTLDSSFDEAITRVTAALKSEGFGILTEIDVQNAFKEKLGVDFRKYRILGACNPAMAHKALQAEDKIGTMLPCNVVVQETDSGRIEVSAVAPLASMQAVDNPDLAAVAQSVQAKLNSVVDSL